MSAGSGSHCCQTVRLDMWPTGRYSKISRVQSKCDGTRWRTGEELKGKLANGVGSQYPSHYLRTWCIQHYYRWWRTPRLPVADWTDAPADLNGLVRFAERRNLVSARVPSHFNWPLLLTDAHTNLCSTSWAGNNTSWFHRQNFIQQ